MARDAAPDRVGAVALCGIARRLATSAVQLCPVNSDFPLEPDALLRAAVVAQLTRQPALSGCELTVEARDGVVTLFGRVRSEAEHWYAERAVLRVDGVREVLIRVETEQARRPLPTIPRQKVID